jgi:hypothetical protein
MRSPIPGRRIDTEAGPPMSKPPRLAGLDGSPTSDVSSVAHEPARPDTPALPDGRAWSSLPERTPGADDQGASSPLRSHDVKRRPSKERQPGGHCPSG